MGSDPNHKTLYDKLWDAHVVHSMNDNQALIYIDRHLIHEVSSPMAFDSLRRKGLPVRRPHTHLAVPDHVVPTTPRSAGVSDPLAKKQISLLEKNTETHAIPFIDMHDPRQGIVHVIGPEFGFTQPGITLTCGDSHTATHGAFGALAFGIGASECRTVLAAQCIRQARLKPMRITIDGRLPRGVTAKDLILHFLKEYGTAVGFGYAIEYAGEAIRALSMEERMTLCNMAIEAGARVGLIAPDDTTFAYLEGRPYMPVGHMRDHAISYWRSLPSDEEARFDKSFHVDASALAPVVTWGTDPQQASSIDGRIPYPDDLPATYSVQNFTDALHYMGLSPGQKVEGIPVDHVFIGSCTNGRLSDIRQAAEIVRGRKVAPTVRAMVVPGSGAVKRMAEAEGLDRIFKDAGFEWREPGCSMCVSINQDRLLPGERCASTSNRNFEGRQGLGGRTHLVSPYMAAAAAIKGHFFDARKLLG